MLARDPASYTRRVAVAVYSRADTHLAKAVVEGLEVRGWSVFWDRNIVAGTTWDDVLDHELHVCRCVVVLWSASAISSGYVKAEAAAGFERGILVPASLDDAAALRFWLSRDRSTAAVDR